MAMYIKYELVETEGIIVPECLSFEIKSGESYELYWGDLTIGIEPKDQTYLVAKLKDLSLIDESGKRIEDNSEIARICSQFKRFSDITWEEVGRENDYITEPTILQVVLDIAEPIVMYERL